MVTIVTVERNPPRLEQDEPKRAPRSARPQSAQPVRSELTTPASPSPTPSAEQTPTSDPLSASGRYRRISLGAYFRAEQRGFAPGHAWEDWLAAERELESESEPRSTSGNSGSTK
jgi:hypothetical protein